MSQVYSGGGCQQVCGDTSQFPTQVMSHSKTNKETQAQNLLMMTVLLTQTCWRTERGHIFNFRETSRTIQRHPDIAHTHRLRGSLSLLPRLLSAFLHSVKSSTYASAAEVAVRLVRVSRQSECVERTGQSRGGQRQSDVETWRFE